MKRLIDLVGCGVVLVVTAPLLATISLAVKLTSPGPVFFRQARLGKGGVPFRIFKFRTMHHLAPDIRNEDGSAFTGRADPRVTPIGRFLRRTSLDELPQFFNVAVGDMSLVGPRPDQMDQIKYYTKEETRKLDVKPGITGLAQISGRNEISWAQRKALDVRYVRERSTALDIAILLKTIPYVLRGSGVTSQ